MRLQRTLQSGVFGKFGEFKIHIRLQENKAKYRSSVGLSGKPRKPLSKFHNIGVLPKHCLQLRIEKPACTEKRLIAVIGIIKCKEAFGLLKCFVHRLGRETSICRNVQADDRISIPKHTFPFILVNGKRFS